MVTRALKTHRCPGIYITTIFLLEYKQVLGLFRDGDLVVCPIQVKHSKYCWFVFHGFPDIPKSLGKVNQLLWCFCWVVSGQLQVKDVIFPHFCAPSVHVIGILAVSCCPTSWWLLPPLTLLILYVSFIPVDRWLSGSSTQECLLRVNELYTHIGSFPPSFLL